MTVASSIIASGSVWTPQRLGTKLKFCAMAPKVGDLSRITIATGTDIAALANRWGSAGPMTSTSGKYTRLDSSMPQNGYAAIRTWQQACDLAQATGGPSGAGAYQLIAFARSIAQPVGANTTFMLAGDPGNGGAGASNSGIGYEVPSNGNHYWCGGGGNTTLGGTALGNCLWDNGLHLIDSYNDGANSFLRIDGGRQSTTPVVPSLTSGRMGLSGFYPLASPYGPPDTMVYAAFWIQGNLTDQEHVSLCRWTAREYAFTPRRRFLVIGDSITAGHIAGAGTTNTPTYVEYIASQYTAATGEIVYTKNQGITSQTTSQILARVNASLLSWFPPPGFGIAYGLIMGGTNNGITAANAAAAYADCVAISNAFKAVGVKSVIGTMFPTATMNSTNLADLAIYNALILANTGGADYVCDLRSLVPDATDTSKLPDGIHPSDALNAQIATRYRTLVG